MPERRLWPALLGFSMLGTSCGDAMGPEAVGISYGSATAISQGSAHTCALTTAGVVACWGSNVENQLGRGYSWESDSVARPVVGNLRFLSVSATGVPLSTHGHTCALAINGAVYCWGGLLGLRGPNPRYGPRPTPVAIGYRFAALDIVGDNFCALTAEGAAYCWLRDNEPVPLTGGHRFISISAAPTCAVTTDGDAYCWDGQSWDSIPQRVPGGQKFVSISTGGGPVYCALTAEGAAYCWGWNTSGVLGIGSDGGYFPEPVPVAGTLVFASISVGIAGLGLRHMCGVTRDGVAYCWGSNWFGTLGIGTEEGPERCISGGFGVPCSTVPVAVVVGSGRFTSVSVASGTCAVSVDGAVWCWGSVPQKIPGLG